MENKDFDAAAKLLKVVDARFLREDACTPIRRITPTEFVQLCKQCEVSPNTAYLLATFAVALAGGLLGEKEAVAVAVGGKESGALGGCLIVQVEELRRAMGGA